MPAFEEGGRVKRRREWGSVGRGKGRASVEELTYTGTLIDSESV
jgi:hypothetical protein